MRVLVCGGRDYADRSRVFDELNRLRPAVVIQGGANGADRLAAEWAYLKGAKLETFNANWLKHRKAAGPIRNQRMIDEGRPDLVVAFPGGRGTSDMVSRAKAAWIEVAEIAPKAKPVTNQQEG